MWLAFLHVWHFHGVLRIYLVFGILEFWSHFLRVLVLQRSRGVNFVNHFCDYVTLCLFPKFSDLKDSWLPAQTWQHCERCYSCELWIGMAVQETLVDLLTLLGRSACLPVAICCSSRDSLDAVCARVTASQQFSVAFLVDVRWIFFLLSEVNLLLEASKLMFTTLNIWSSVAHTIRHRPTLTVLQ
jgi:hypothetical protein